MVKIILDANFLFIPFQFRIDIFNEVEALLGKAEPIVLSTTLKELGSLAERKSEKMRRQAVSALKLTKLCRIVEAEKRPDESNDDVLLRVAKEWNCPVATNDVKLRKRLRADGIATVFLRKRSHLEIEGYIDH